MFWGGIVAFYGGILSADPYKSGSIAISVAKVVTPAWHQIFLRAIGCNWLVCLAIWLSTSAKDLQSKVIGAYLPIFAFVGVGFEHVSSAFARYKAHHLGCCKHVYRPNRHVQWSSNWRWLVHL